MPQATERIQRQEQYPLLFVTDARLNSDYWCNVGGSVIRTEASRAESSNVFEMQDTRDGIAGLSRFANHTSDHCDDTTRSSVVRGELDNARELERVLFKESSDEEAARRNLSIVVRVRS